MINKYGQCPHCGENLDGGDMLKNLSKIEVLSNKKTKELIAIAHHYGYTESNRTHFTKLHVYQLQGKDTRLLFSCPKCGHIWDGDNVTEYKSMHDALKRVLIEPKTKTKAEIDIEVNADWTELEILMEKLVKEDDNIFEK